jgi:hypothetical protein
MANQYCKITSWIEHNKKHPDHSYANAITQLCLESSFNPTKYNGLTFLYQTDKSIRKKFSSGLFTSVARDMVNEVKRHILPDVFLSCEDFQTKDVGNLLKNKYEVKSCTKDTVTFANGMKIQAIENNSFEPLSEQLKDVIRIYYIIEGEPPKDNKENYKIVYRKKLNKHSLSMMEGGNPNRKKLIRGGTAQEFETVYADSNLGEFIKNLSLGNIRTHGNYALHIALTMINNKLNPSEAPAQQSNTDMFSDSIGSSDGNASSDGNVSSDGNASSDGNVSSNSNVSSDGNGSSDSIFSDGNVSSNDNSSEEKAVTLGGNELDIDNLKNLILAQWLVNSCEEGIIAYIYLCLFVLYKSEPANDAFRMFIHELITEIFKVISGDRSEVTITGENYFDELKSISSSLGFNISDVGQETQYKICEFINRLKQAEAPDEFVHLFFNRISKFKTIWGGTFIPTFFGNISEIMPVYGAYLGLWTLTLFSSSLEDVDTHGKLTMLDNEFCKLIRESNNSELDRSKLTIELVFTEETLNKFLNKRQPISDNSTSDLQEALSIATNQEVVTDSNNLNFVSGGLFD